jgi:hypothetical protein
MNIEGSFQHILTDLLAFIFTAVAGVVILATGFNLLAAPRCEADLLARYEGLSGDLLGDLMILLASDWGRCSV